MKRNEIIATLLGSSLLAETATVKDVKEFAAKFETATPAPTSDLNPRLTEDKKGIYIPILGRTIAIEGIVPNEEKTWQQAMDYCESKGLELPSKEEALILIWQLEKINTLLTSVGVDKLGEGVWYWTKTQYSATFAWRWYCGSWNSSYNRKAGSYAVVPFFAI